MDLDQIVGQFQINEHVKEITPFGSGHVNETFCVSCTNSTKYLLQQINTTAFNEPEKVMENIALVSGHLDRRIHNSQERYLTTAKVISTKDDQFLYRDERNRAWRMFSFIENARTYDKVEDIKIASIAARTYGKFAMLLSDLDPSNLHITIPKFHDFHFRQENLKRAIRVNSAKRLQLCEKEVEMALEWCSFGGKFQALIDSNKLTLAVVHNDTKINNVLINSELNEGIAVIDLDTVMPGYLLHDFGDMVRTSISPSDEDDSELNNIRVRIDFFEALVTSYLSETKSLMSDAEKENLVESGMFMTLIMAYRFLTDYLEGDVYYKTTKPDHNLHRVKNQLHLLSLISKDKMKLKEIVKRLTD